MSVLALILVWILTIAPITFLINSYNMPIFFSVTYYSKIVMTVSRIMRPLLGSDLWALFFFSSVLNCFIYWSMFLMFGNFCFFFIHSYHWVNFCYIIWLAPFWSFVSSYQIPFFFVFDYYISSVSLLISCAPRYFSQFFDNSAYPSETAFCFKSTPLWSLKISP